MHKNYTTFPCYPKNMSLYYRCNNPFDLNLADWPLYRLRRLNGIFKISLCQLMTIGNYCTSLQTKVSMNYQCKLIFLNPINKPLKNYLHNLFQQSIQNILSLIYIKFDSNSKAYFLITCNILIQLLLHKLPNLMGHNLNLMSKNIDYFRSSNL